MRKNSAAAEKKLHGTGTDSGAIGGAVARGKGVRRKTIIPAGAKRKPFDRSSSTLTAKDGLNDMEVEFKLKEKLLQPDKVYRFHCDGVISRKLKKMRSKEPADKSVKYRAQFSGSVEEFIYPSLRPQEKLTNSASQPLDFSVEDEQGTNDFSLHWKLDLEDKTSSEQEDGREATKISDKGENTLRELLRKKYHERLSKEVLKLRAARDAAGAASKQLRKKNLLHSMFGDRKGPSENATPDEVYYDMVCKGKADGLIKTVKKNAVVSVLERSHDEKAETLARVLPSSQTDPDMMAHVSGLLYYQIKKDISEKKMNDRLQRTTSIPAPHTTNWDMSSFNEDDESSALSSENGGRARAPITRSLSSIQNRGIKFREHRGITQDFIDEDDNEEVVAESLHAMTNLKHTANDYSCNSMSRVRRAHFSVMDGFQVGERVGVDDDEGGFSVTLTVEEKKRRAQDVLLGQQLRLGVIPEQLLRKIPRMGDLISLDLSHYGMGDDVCTCLGKSLGVLEMLHTLGLRGNRLTHKSLVDVFQNLSMRALRHLDVSVNNISGPSVQQLCARLRSKDCKLSSLELVKTGISYSDVKLLSEAIMTHETSWLMELSLAQNHLSIESMRELVTLLKYSGCALSWLDLSWNDFNASSGEVLAEALTVNKSLTSLDLSSNALRDEGGQHIAACLLSNKNLEEIYLTLNNIGGKTCFIFSKVLRRHPSMKRLNISDNPLTEAGARSIFRTILRGLRCFVMMQSCTFNSATGLFKHSNPSLDSPYTLNLAEPYEVSILSELINMVNDSTSQCTFRNLRYRQNERDKGVEIVPEYSDGETFLRCGSNPWGIPSTGLLTVHFLHQLSIPKEDMAIDELAFNTILAIVVNARSEKDRKNWLFLMCMDAYFTTSQAQDLIDILDDRRLLGPGGVSVVEFFRCIWSNIIDTENIYDFMYHNLDDAERVSLMHLLSFEKFKFNWLNATGHWRLDLNNRLQRSVMMQIIALNIVESKASKKAKRGDTSQKGNWCNFRNEKFNGSPCAIDMDFSKSLPWNGVLEFDYVATTRPPPDAEEISDEDFSNFILKLDLTTRRRCDLSRSALKLLELQLAVTNFYFKASRVINIMDCFSEDDMTQVRVVIVLFCRIVDLHNLELVFRHLPAGPTQDLFERLGVLNCINPLKPTHNLKLNMRFIDCRILAHTFLSMSSFESGDQLKQHPRSDVDIIVMYSQLGRVIADEHSTDTYLMFTYCEVGERQSEIAWNYRIDMCQKFLVGSKPWDTKMFRIIKMYKEIVAEKALMMGPIDLQYKSFIRNKNVKRGRNVLRSAGAMGVVGRLKNMTAASRTVPEQEGTEESSGSPDNNNGNSRLLDSISGGTELFPVEE